MHQLGSSNLYSRETQRELVQDCPLQHCLFDGRSWGSSVCPSVDKRVDKKILGGPHRVTQSKTGAVSHVWLFKHKFKSRIK